MIKNTDILLIRALGPDNNNFPPIGLFYIKSYLENNGFKAEIFDRYVDRDIKSLKKNVPVFRDNINIPEIYFFKKLNLKNT